MKTNRLSGKYYLFILLFLSGCSKMVYTREVVDHLHTKADLVKELGEPDKKTPYPGFEEWVYYRDTLSTLNQSDTLSNSRIVPIKDSLTNKIVALHTASIKFHIDSANRIISYKNDGVNLSKKVKENFGASVLDVLAGTLVILLVVGYEIAKDKIDL
ncbi:hypothetical protein [Mucilaginibacter gotjawali]|uniref:Lipoprotein n=1 Tax=Mucilaginibacter gotjawali TaxID=1550579 RepID=A0A839SF25_9SPHI|nr:hypothetical protein [Mucilaginibacter gotjawali]MBB3055882.1 hypothetical protein [Mucilaginibacter gotjawali]